MTSQELLEVIGETQDEYILDAKAPHRKHAPMWIKWVAAAACLCLILGMMRNRDPVCSCLDTAAFKTFVPRFSPCFLQ